MCIHGFVKFMQNLCSDLKVLRTVRNVKNCRNDERDTTRSFSGNICKLTPRTILNALWQLVRSRHLRGLWNRGAVANFSFKRSVVPLSAGWQFLSFWICTWQHKSSLDMSHQITTCKHASMIPLAPCIII